jgi:hypothetical protein
MAFDHQLAEGRKAAQIVRELCERLEAHAETDPTPTQGSNSSAGGPFCAFCQRDGASLRDLRAVLVKSELPPGFICSICLAGH